jgi:hypothetical protein
VAHEERAIENTIALPVQSLGKAQPWFDLKKIHEARRDAYLDRNGGFLVSGYEEWLARYAWTPVAHAVHPASAPLPDDARPDALPQVSRWRPLQRSTIQADLQTRAQSQR